VGGLGGEVGAAGDAVDVGPSLTAVREGVGGRGLGDVSEEPHADSARQSPNVRMSCLPLSIEDLDTVSMAFVNPLCRVCASNILLGIMPSGPPDRTTLWG
jgi:hypothetical protein